MFVRVIFKNKDMEFTGKTYDFEVVGKVPKRGDIIRMMSEDGTKKVCNATRVKVVSVLDTSTTSVQKITCVPSSMDEPSISKT